MSAIEHRADIQVGRPLERDAIRGVDRGILVTCTDSYCAWQGLFPDAELASQAAERHYDHEARSGEYHFGSRTYTIVALLDGETAVTLDDSQLGLSVPEIRMGTVDGGVRETTFPRTTERVDELVNRGDVITRPPDREAVVHQVTETRSLGMPTWTVVYVAPDVDLLDARPKQDFKWINECIAQDGEVYVRYGSDQLQSPAFEVVGSAEHQADFAEFAARADGGGGR